MRLAIILDPLDSIKTYKDTTFAMMQEASQRGHSMFAIMQGDIALKQEKVVVLAKPITLTGKEPGWYRTEKELLVPLAEFDAVLMRKDPPFNMEYIYSTYLLELAENQGAKIFNKPRALRDLNEKMATTIFTEFSAPTLVTRRSDLILEFLDEHKDIILKPLDGMGGRSIFRATKTDYNVNAIIEVLTDFGTKTIMVQRYIPEISKGDKRILLIAGKPVPYTVARIPKPGETRGNLDMGGKAVVQPLSDRERKIAEILAPKLYELGVLLTGLDVIGDYVTEINITSPSCFPEIKEQAGFNVAGMMLDALEEEIL